MKIEKGNDKGLGQYPETYLFALKILIKDFSNLLFVTVKARIIFYERAGFQGKHHLIS